MSKEETIRKLRKVIFEMLNFANMYVLMLDDEMVIKFANASLANDLGFDDYHNVLGRCWLDFISEEDIKVIQAIHGAITRGNTGWYEKYKEYRNDIVAINGERINVHWFNSFMNSDYNWTFSFGIKQNPQEQHHLTIDSVRKYYEDIIKKDRTMINSVKEMIEIKNQTCQPNFVVKD